MLGCPGAPESRTKTIWVQLGIQDGTVRSSRELLSPCAGCVSGEEAWLFFTDDSSCEMVLASGIPMACLPLVKLGSDLNGAGRDFGICELERAQGP